MKKVLVLLVVFGLCAGLGLIIYGCGSSTSTSTTTPTTTPTPTPTGEAPAIGSVTITGSLAPGTIRTSAIKLSSGIKVQATITGNALKDYNVCAVSKETGKIFYPKEPTDSSGNFEIAGLPSGESFYVDILDSHNKLAAPIAMGSDTDGKLIMTVTPEAKTAEVATIALGPIAFESDKAVAVPVTEPASFEDKSTDAKAEPKTAGTLVPKGSGANLGKGDEAKIASGTTFNSDVADGDKDGLPNIFDADNNGDKIVDEFDGLCTMEVLSTAPTKIDNAQIFTNIKVNYGSTVEQQKNVPTGFWVIMNVSGKTGHTISAVTVETTTAPSWISLAKIYQPKGGSFEDYPTTGEPFWQTYNYKLFKSSEMPSGGTSVSNSNYGIVLGGGDICPVTTATGMKAGDSLTFIVTFDDGKSEKITKMINFAYTDVPVFKGYYFGNWNGDKTKFTTYAGDWKMGNLDITPPMCTGEVSLKWSKVKDENGNYMSGAPYCWELKEGMWLSPTTTPPIQYSEDDEYAYGYGYVGGGAGLSDTTVSISPGVMTPQGSNAVENCTFPKTTAWGEWTGGGGPKK